MWTLIGNPRTGQARVLTPLGAAIVTTIILGGIMWIVLGSMIGVRNDLVDGTLHPGVADKESCCCEYGYVNQTYQCLQNNCYCLKKIIVFVPNRGNADDQNMSPSTRCRGGGVVDYAALPSEGSFLTIPGSYETVTTDCWVNKPLDILTMAWIGIALTVSIFAVTYLFACCCCFAKN